MKRSTILASALINLFCPAFASEEPKSFAEREFAVKKQVYGIRHPWDMVAPYGDGSPGHPGTMIDSTPFFVVDTIHVITPLSERDPDREFVKTQRADPNSVRPIRPAEVSQIKRNQVVKPVDQYGKNTGGAVITVPEPPYAIYHHPSPLDSYDPYALYWSYSDLLHNWHPFEDDSKRAKPKESERFRFQPNFWRSRPEEKRAEE